MIPKATASHHQLWMILLVLNKKQRQLGEDSHTVFTNMANKVSETGQSQFKLDIRPEPIKEDADAQSAYSSVANTLRAVSSMPRGL